MTHGVGFTRLAAATSDADWHRTLDVNLGGAFRCCRAVLPPMVSRRRGAIVNLSSLAALSGVNESLYEAAEVDGATRVGVLRNVTWPEVAPMTAFLMVTGVIGGLQVFDIVWAMTSATETDSTVTLNLYIFREFQQSRLGYSAAIG
ncbi:MAG: SDR family NAD(P)-dependent oxidoreductase, partial [Candidatus Competibacter denitrificans]